MENNQCIVIFLDRDGVIHEDRSDYVKNASEMKMFACVPDSIRRMNEAGFKVIVISNQQGVGKGIMSREALQEVEDAIDAQVRAGGGEISAYYYCTHLANEDCGCRKPKPGMLIEAAREHNLDLSSAYMIGDTERDLVAAKSAGCRTILVLSGKLGEADLEDLDCKPDFVAKDLSEAADIVLSNTLPH